MSYLLTFLIAFLVSLAAVPLMKTIALRYNILDHPTSEIKTHTRPTPYLGGIAIWLGFIVALVIIRFTTHFSTGTLRNLWGIFIAGTLITIVGLLDDMYNLSFLKKFLWQAIAATILILFTMRIQFIQPSYLAIIFTYLWIIGVTNAFNLIDIMDGLSSGVAIIACLAFFFINAPGEASYVNFAAIALAGACLGFLVFNVPPAGIFMGDTGSMLIGLVLAAVSLGTNYTVNNNIGVITPIIILGVAIYDTFYIMYKRWQRGKSMFLGSKDHFALRLQIMGWPKKKVLMITYCIAASAGCISFFITRVTFPSAVAMYVFVIGIALLIARFLGKVHVE